MERNKKRNRRQWMEIIDEQEGSGLSAKAFCQAKSIGLVSFYQWRRRLRKPVSWEKPRVELKESFIDIGRIGSSDVSTRSGESACVVTLELGEGFKLTLQRS